MSYRALLQGGPLDGITLNLNVVGEGPFDWPPAIGDSERKADGRYVLAERESVPFEMGAHPNILLTATYTWAAEP